MIVPYETPYNEGILAGMYGLPDVGSAGQAPPPKYLRPTNGTCPLGYKLVTSGFINPQIWCYSDEYLAEIEYMKTHPVAPTIPGTTLTPVSTTGQGRGIGRWAIVLLGVVVVWLLLKK